MTDDKTKRDARDGTRVAGGQDSEVQLFAQEHGISMEQARNLSPSLEPTGKFSNEKRGSFYTEDTWRLTHSALAEGMEAEQRVEALPTQRAGIPQVTVGRKTSRRS